MATQDDLKRAVAQAAVDYIIPKFAAGIVIGIGTGSTANCFIDLIAQHKSKFAGAVASSKASAERLINYGITVYDLNDVEGVAVYVDGADEANDKLQLIKGGGAALTREKIVTSCSEEFICIADESKLVDTLGQFPLPVEVIPMAKRHVMKALTQLGGNPVIRKDCITDNGNDIIDVSGLTINDPVELERAINHITGVVTNGLFAIRPADILLLGTAQGIKTISA